MKGLFRIARLESSRSRRAQFDRRSLAVAVPLLVLSGVLFPVALDQGLDFEDGLYRVAFADESPLRDAVAADPAFVVVPDAPDVLRTGAADLRVEGLRVEEAPTDKGRAATFRLRDAVRRHTLDLMARERDADAAFPIRVNLTYERVPDRTPAGAIGGAGGSGGPAAGGAGEGPAPDETEAGAPVSPGAGGFADVLGVTADEGPQIPADLSPPFPFRSLLLAFLFLIPMNFVVQGMGASVMTERVNRLGEALLAAPVSARAIVWGKSLPHLFLMIGVVLVLAATLGGSHRTVLAMLPVALVFAGLELVAALVARSFKELTFLTVFLSVVLTTYLFLPAIFVEVHPIAFISPVSVVAADLKGIPVSTASFLYATVPLALVGLGLFRFGESLVREEIQFSTRGLAAKMLDGIAGLVRRPRSLFVLGIASLPFVFAAELLLLALVFSWPLLVTIPVLVASVALVEEVAKSVGLYAAYSRGRLHGGDGEAVRAGLWSGAGFFVGEKVLLL
ncbi:MAG: PrsW family intramembrane metalloprotease, partial [Methanobacteriota archaeon]